MHRRGSTVWRPYCSPLVHCCPSAQYVSYSAPDSVCFSAKEDVVTVIVVAPADALALLRTVDGMGNYRAGTSRGYSSVLGSKM